MNPKFLWNSHISLFTYLLNKRPGTHESHGGNRRWSTKGKHVVKIIVLNEITQPKHHF